MLPPVLSHFVVPASTDGNFKAKCKHCSSNISGSLNITSNFITHIKRKHRDLTIGKSTQVSAGETSSDQSTLRTFVKSSSKYSQNDVHQNTITNALLMFIAGNLLPLSIVDSSQTKTLFELLDPKYQLPSRKHLTVKLLADKASTIKDKLIQCLKSVDSVCLTVDLWSNRTMKGFLGITGHYISDWSLHTVMIACKRFKGRHSAENIRHEYEEIISTFFIEDKINTVITDNASNMTKAFDFSLPGYAQDKPEEDEDENVDEVECTDEDSHDPCGLFDCLPTHNRCYAHSLQLVVKDGLKAANNQLKSILAKASAIVKFVRCSLHATDLLDGEKRLQAANTTRWNSQLVMIRSLLEIPESKLNTLDTQQLSSYERKILQEVSTILKPFEHATNLIQQSNNVPGSLTIPVTQGLRHQLNALSTMYSNKTLISKAEQFEKITMDAHKESSTPPRKAVKLDDFFSFMTEDAACINKPTSCELNVKDYLRQPCIPMDSDPILFWNQNQDNHPVLAKMACRYLSIPASSAPVERLFSVAGKLFRPDRCSMNDTTFENLMMIKCNSEL